MIMVGAMQASGGNVGFELSWVWISIMLPLAGQSWASDLTSLSLCFLIQKMQEIIAPTTQNLGDN